MGPLESLDVAALFRGISVLVQVGLAVFFGRTLRAGEQPLIERIARVSDPALPPALVRYTRRLTALWCVYFVAAAAWSLTTSLRFGGSNLGVGAGAVVLFVGERWLRPRLFPGHAFPGLVQQLRDTWSVWGRKARRPRA